MSTKVKYTLILAFFAIALFTFNSCGIATFGYFYIINETDKPITNITVTWESDEGSKSFNINKVEPNGKSDTYAAKVSNKDDLFRSTTKNYFYINYQLDGVDFDYKYGVNVSYESDQDKGKDLGSYFKWNKTTKIKIYPDRYVVENND